MPFKDEEDRRRYIREYMRKYRKEPHPSDTQIYSEPPVLDDADIEAMKSGLTKAELDRLNEDIQDALSQPNLDEFYEYTKLSGPALKRLSRGEAGLIFGIGGREVDINGEPIKKKDDDEEVGHWGRFVG